MRNRALDALLLVGLAGALAATVTVALPIAFGAEPPKWIAASGLFALFSLGLLASYFGPIRPPRNLFIFFVFALVLTTLVCTSMTLWLIALISSERNYPAIFYPPFLAQLKYEIVVITIFLPLYLASYFTRARHLEQAKKKGRGEHS